MTPYYQRGPVTLYFGDCRAILPRLPSESFDLLISDPPYGQDYQGGRAGKKIAGDEDQTTAKEGLALAVPLVTRRRHVYIFGRYGWLTDLTLSQPVELTWDKGLTNPGGSELWGNQHEYIQFATVTGDCERRGELMLTARRRRGSVLRYQRPNGLRHPSEKPVGLLRELVESSSRIGERVLDPFCGVGSTLVAALLEGRGAVGVEIDEDHCETAARRIDRVLNGGLLELWEGA